MGHRAVEIKMDFTLELFVSGLSLAVGLEKWVQDKIIEDATAGVTAQVKLSWLLVPADEEVSGIIVVGCHDACCKNVEVETTLHDAKNFIGQVVSIATRLPWGISDWFKQASDGNLDKIVHDMFASTLPGVLPSITPIMQLLEALVRSYPAPEEKLSAVPHHMYESEHPSHRVRRRVQKRSRAPSSDSEGVPFETKIRAAHPAVQKPRTYSDASMSSTDSGGERGGRKTPQRTMYRFPEDSVLQLMLGVGRRRKAHRGIIWGDSKGWQPVTASAHRMVLDIDVGNKGNHNDSGRLDPLGADLETLGARDFYFPQPDPSKMRVSPVKDVSSGSRKSRTKSSDHTSSKGSRTSDEDEYPVDIFSEAPKVHRVRREERGLTPDGSGNQMDDELRQLYPGQMLEKLKKKSKSKFRARGTL